MIHRIFVAGFGGQGILSIGKMIAYAAMMEGKETTFIPSYGAEMRGGTANCSVIVSDKKIGCPIFQKADTVVAMNQVSLEKFETMVFPDGNLLINSSIISILPMRNDVNLYSVPVNELADLLGLSRAANMVMLGVLIKVTGVVQVENIRKVVQSEFSGRKSVFLEANLAALDIWKMI